jgi:hypothetical protein
MADLEKTPTADTSVNSPASGTYGEKADLNRLKQSLPPMGPGPGPQGPQGPEPLKPGSAPTVPGRMGRPTQAPAGVPGAIMHPTDRPDVPVGNPLSAPPQEASPYANDRSQREARITLLLQMAESPQVSAATREWAKIVIEQLTSAE